MLMGGHQHRVKPTPTVRAKHDAGPSARRQSHGSHGGVQPISTSVLAGGSEFSLHGRIEMPWNLTIHRNIPQTFILWTSS